MNNQVAQVRRQRAIEDLRIKMANIPESDSIFQSMVGDWILNADADELANMPEESWIDLVNDAYKDAVRNQQGMNANNANIQIPFRVNEYNQMLNHFIEFVRAYYEEQGNQNNNVQMAGRRRKRRAQTRRKSARRSKKTRKHK
jgi:hypothetical protein